MLRSCSIAAAVTTTHCPSFITGSHLPLSKKRHAGRRRTTQAAAAPAVAFIQHTFLLLWKNISRHTYYYAENTGPRTDSITAVAMEWSPDCGVRAWQSLPIRMDAETLKRPRRRVENRRSHTLEQRDQFGKQPLHHKAQGKRPP